MMNEEARRLGKLVAPTVESFGFQLWGCVCYRQGVRDLFRVYIEGPSGVGIEDCARISRQISALLDVKAQRIRPYDLEVSSPGIERPLLTIEHYRRFVGRPVYVRLTRMGEGRRSSYRGIIEKVTDGVITLRCEQGQKEISVEAIERANLTAEWRGIKHE